MDISIIIPTKNRIKYLLRVLKYYENLKFNGKIILVDGSSDEKYNEICQNIKIFKLDIEIYKSSFVPLLAIREIIDKVNTKYVTTMGDDDYQIPQGLQKSINILDSRVDIIGCHGIGLIIQDPIYNKNYKITDPGLYPGPHTLQDSPYERLIYQLENYACPSFSVFRTKSYQNIFGNLNNNDILKNCKDRLIHDELLHSALMVIEGKIIRENFLQVIRGHHPGRKIDKDHWKSMADKKDRIDSINYYTTIVTKRLLFKTNISKKQTMIISQALKNFILSYEKNKEPVNIYSYRLIIKKIFRYLGILNTFFFIRELFFKNEFKIKNLLNKKSIYYNDFRQVYDSIMNFKS